MLHPLDLPGTPTMFEEHSVGAEAGGKLSKPEGDLDYEVVHDFRILRVKAPTVASSSV